MAFGIRRRQSSLPLVHGVVGYAGWICVYVATSFTKGQMESGMILPPWIRVHHISLHPSKSCSNSLIEGCRSNGFGGRASSCKRRTRALKQVADISGNHDSTSLHASRCKQVPQRCHAFPLFSVTRFTVFDSNVFSKTVSSRNPRKSIVRWCGAPKS